jgi:hypothetical protein
MLPLDRRHGTHYRNHPILGSSAHSGINANVHNEPPDGTLSTAKRGARAPPNPDAIDTYC